MYSLILKYAYVNMRKVLLNSNETKQIIWNLQYCKFPIEGFYIYIRILQT